MLTLAGPKKSVIIHGRKQISSEYTDGSEMIEEFDVITDELLLRKIRRRQPLGGFGDWVVEVGCEARSRNLAKELIVEAVGTPELVSQDTKEHYIWRIRNLPYPKDVFDVSIETREGDGVGEIVVRTSNKKYFKRIDVPDMVRAKIPLEKSNLTFDVKHHTLIIQYKKHLSILASESVAKKERSSMPAKRIEDTEQGCPQQ